MSAYCHHLKVRLEALEMLSERREDFREDYEFISECKYHLLKYGNLDLLDENAFEDNGIFDVCHEGREYVLEVHEGQIYDYTVY